MNGTVLLKDDFLNMVVDESALSVRSYNVLKRDKGNKRENPVTMKDIWDKWNKLSSIHGLGTKSVKEIRDFFINTYICQATDKEIKIFWDSLMSTCTKEEYALTMLNLIDLELNERSKVNE